MWSSGNGDTSTVWDGAQSISLDGISNYIEIPSSDSLSFQTQLSISFWVKTTSTTPAVAFSKTRGTGSTYHFGLTHPITHQFYFKTYPVNNFSAYRELDGTVAFNEGVWTHGLVTFNASAQEMKLYKNGVQDAGATISIQGNPGWGIVQTNSPLSISVNFVDQTPGLEGQFFGLAMWNDVLTAAEALEIYQGRREIDLTSNTGNYTSSGDLAAYWRFLETDMEGPGGVIDSSGNANHGTFMGGMTNANITRDAP